MLEINLPEVDTIAKSEAGVTFPIISLKTGEAMVNCGVPVTITVKGPDSVAYRDALRAIDRKRVELVRDAPNGELTTAQQDALQSEMIAAVTVAWTGMLSKDGQEAPCTRENAQALYMRFPAIRDQIAIRADNRRNFTTASPDA